MALFQRRAGAAAPTREACVHFRLSVLMFLLYAVMGCWVPLFSVYLDGLGFTPLQVASACATMGLSYLIVPFAAGQMADRWLAAERCITIGSIIAGASLWFLAELDDPDAVFWTCLLIWIVQVPVVTIGNAVALAHLREPERHFGKVRLWGTVGWMASAWLVGLWLWLGATAGLLGGQASLADIFRIGAGLALLLAVYALTLPSTPPQRRGHGWLAPLQALRLLRRRDYAVYFAGTFLLYCTYPCISQLTPLLLRSIAVGEELLAPLLTTSQGVEILMLWLLPGLLGRLGTRDTMLLGLAVWTSGLWLLALGQPVWLVVAALPASGVCVACFMVAGQVFLNGGASGHIRASAQSLLVFVNGLGLLVGNLLVGCIRDWTWPALAPTFAAAGCLALGLVVFYAIGFPRRRWSLPDLTIGPRPSPCVEPAENL
jgi:MFS family permease